MIFRRYLTSDLSIKCVRIANIANDKDDNKTQWPLGFKISSLFFISDITDNMN